MSHSATLLFEIGCEEMPAAFMRGTLEQLRTLLEEALRESRLPFSSIATYGTPRRLIALAYEVATHQTPEERTVRGPARRACFDAEGKPTQALLGFARAQGVEPEQVQFMETPQGEYAFVRVRDEGQPAVTVLAERLPALIRQMTFPKTLRWGTHQLRFGRPIRWIVAMLGEQVIEFEIDGIRSGRFSCGHRFRAPQPFEVRSPEEFLQQLREAHVIADPEERKALIREEALRLAREVDAQPLLSDDLLEENTFLVEYPHLLRGAFPEAFLRLPAPVLISAMKKHEKFFPLVDSSGNLLPGFISVYNNGNPDYVREGNEWVLVARFNDASFFFEEDLKQPLEAFVQGLGRMLFQQKLGTLLDKTRRLQRLAERLARALDWDRPTQECLLRAAWLCKADLATQMVMEFPDLQGIIGEEYARRAGEPLCVARAIAEHYQPRYAGDALPQTPIGRALAVLDRIDTLVGYVGLGYLPKGSSDPFGLRRAATGVVEILAEEPDYPTLSELVQVAHDEYRADGVSLKPLAALQPDLRTLFYSRIEALLEEQGIRYDLIRAVLGGGWDDSVYGFVQRARWLHAQQATPAFQTLTQTATRPANILAAARKKNIHAVASLNEIDPTLFEHEVESRLYHALQLLTPQIEALYYKHDYEAIYSRLQELDEPVNRLFDHVLVMTEEEALRRNRLNLLACANRLYLALADFTQVVEG
ncbi:MAG: glycine--tRNA ligase subunit beta [Armatimonadota bacterium]